MSGEPRPRRRGAGLPAALALAAAPFLALAGAVGAQDGPLDRIDSLAAEGRAGEARADLEEWLRGPGARAPRAEAQRALWLRGRLSLDPAAAEVAYRRLLVEYPGGPYAARALLRLARLTEAEGDLPGAAELHHTLARDYPGSPEQLEARRWLDRHGARAAELAVLRSPAEGAVPTPVEPPAATHADPPAETREERPAAVPAEPPAETREEPPTEIREEPPADAGDYTVQLGAFSTVERARSFASTVEERGFVTRLVRVGESPLVRVRVGRFRGPGPARELLDRLRSLGFDTALATDAAREVSVR